MPWVTFCVPHIGFTTKQMPSQSFRAAGSMSLICSGIDFDIIKLISNWHTDEVLL